MILLVAVVILVLLIVGIIIVAALRRRAKRTSPKSPMSIVAAPAPAPLLGSGRRSDVVIEVIQPPETGVAMCMYNIVLTYQAIQTKLKDFTAKLLKKYEEEESIAQVYSLLKDDTILEYVHTLQTDNPALSRVLSRECKFGKVDFYYRWIADRWISHQNYMINRLPDISDYREFYSIISKKLYE